MGPALRILDEIIICVASSICYTQTKLPKNKNNLPNNTNCISLHNNDRITNNYLLLSEEYFNSILIYHLFSCPVGDR